MTEIIKDPSLRDSLYPEIPEYDSELSFTNIDDAINTYVATRDDLKVATKDYNTYEARAKNYLERIEMFIKDKADDLGVDSFKTKSGTAYRAVKTSYRVVDWDSYWAWLVANGYSQCVEKRAAKNAVKEIHEAEGEIPPGLDHIVEVGFDVRRPTK